MSDEAAKKIYEQLQGGVLVYRCGACGLQAGSVDVFAQHVAVSGHGKETGPPPPIRPARRARKVDVSGNDPELHRLAQPSSQKPAVTAEQYARGREVLDALPPGIYLKCSRCFKWQSGGDIHFQSGNETLCERCAT